MRRVIIEVVALCAAVAFALEAIRTVSASETVAFFIALIGSMAIWEGIRFVLNRLVPRPRT